MIIPRDVLIECSREFNMPEAADLVERRVIHTANAADRDTIDRVFATVSEPDALRLQSVARWRSYLTFMHFKFYEIWNHLRQAKRERVSSDFRTGSGGEVFVSTDSFTALPIAAYLYHLESWKVQGNVIECGCFKGVSSAMLSWACKLTGRQLWIADSFCGLPASIGVDEQYFKAGDYSGSLDQVRRTVRTFGCEDAVTYVPGFFEESLPFVRAPFALVWADVDLKTSMESVLEWMMPQLHPEGVLFSDEVTAASFDGACIRADAGSVPGAIRDYFGARNITIPGRNLSNSVSAFVPRGQSELLLSIGRLQGLLLQSTRPATSVVRRVA